ncbi:AAA family ATPase, partial [candidate division KSB1 bacterium]|nr:AAA family ATPase [candidate division KSB1 bacterium]
EAVEQLKSKLFYLQSSGDRYLFNNQANLNRLMLNNMENVKENEVTELESELLRKAIGGFKFRTYIWEENSGNILDSEELKLVVLKKENKKLVNELIKTKGQTPRVNRNTLFFFYPMESERSFFSNVIKRKIALENIASDKNINLTEDQKKEVSNELKKLKGQIDEAIRKLYRIIAIPEKDGFKTKDLGIPTFGMTKNLDEEIYDQLRMDDEILDKIAPLVIKEKYLTARDYVSTAQLFNSSLSTPGEARPSSQQVLENGIREGVFMGLFGLGELIDDNPQSVYFKESPTVSFSGNEIIIKNTICEEQIKESEKPKVADKPTPESEKFDFRGEEIETDLGKIKKSVKLKIPVPKGKVSNLMGMMNLLNMKFKNLTVEIEATDGSISEQDYEDKIMETLRQMGMEI